MYLEGERETWEGEGATGAAWKCLAKWRGTGPAPTTTPFGHRAACLARVGRGGFSAATAAQALGSSHSDRPPPSRVLSPGSGTRAFPAQRQHPEVRSDQGRRRCAQMPVGAHAPHPRGRSKSERGLLGTRFQARVSSTRVQVTCPSGPPATSWRLGGQSPAMSTLRMPPR